MKPSRLHRDESLVRFSIRGASERKGEPAHAPLLEVDPVDDGCDGMELHRVVPLEHVRTRIVTVLVVLTEPPITCLVRRGCAAASRRLAVTPRGEHSLECVALLHLEEGEVNVRSERPLVLREDLTKNACVAGDAQCRLWSQASVRKNL